MQTNLNGKNTRKIVIDWELVNTMLSNNCNEIEIAEKLGICFNTLNAHTKHIYGITFRNYKNKQLNMDGLTPQQRYYLKNKEKCKLAKQKSLLKRPDYFKEHYQKNHNKILQQRQNHRNENIEQYKIKERRKRLLIKEKVINGYGGKCKCCGETLLDFLTIDHINNDGAIHRKEFGRAGKIHRWIISNNFPEEFQVLCFNCNYSKFLNNGKCIHQIYKEIK
jgi:hypothetical protein